MDTQKIITVAKKLHSMLPKGYRMSTGSHENMLIDTPAGKQYSFQYYPSFVMVEGLAGVDIVHIDYDDVNGSAQMMLDLITGN